MAYWLIKLLLVTALGVIIFLLVRPAKNESSLAVRRIGMVLVLLAAIFAIIFPGVFNRFARLIGVSNGTNLLVYMLVIVILAQMVIGYRKDAETQRKMTELARKLALTDARLHSLETPLPGGDHHPKRSQPPGEQSDMKDT